MVGAAEGPLPHQGIVRRQQSQDRADLGGLQRLLPGHVRKDRRQAAREHALAGARRAHQKNVVAACGGNLQGALGVLLSLDVAEIQHLPLRAAGLPFRLRLNGSFSAQMGCQLGHVLHGINGDALGQGGLRRVLRGDIQALESLLLRRQRHRQYAGHRTDSSLQTQFAQERTALLRQTAEVGGAENAQKNGQIIKRAGLPGAGGGKIAGNAADGKFEAGILDRGPDPLPGLLDRGVGQTDNIKGGQAVGNIALHLNLISVDAAQAEGMHIADHRAASFSIQNELSELCLYHIAFTGKKQRPKSIC